MIRTKIAQILSPTRVVLAAGTEQGVKEGMEFIIYELSDLVVDPETKESLGHLELHKGRVKAIHVQEKLATAVTQNRKTYLPGWFGQLNMPPSLMQGRWMDLPEQLPIDSAVATVEEKALKVRVGDLVRSLD